MAPVAVADPGGKLDGLGTEAGHDDRRRLGRRVEQPGVLDLVEVAPVVDGLARPQPADDLDRLLEHRQPHLGWRPAMAEDVLVERLARADAEEEPAVRTAARWLQSAWARIAGWMRMIGHVTPTPCRPRSVDAAIAPSTDQTNGLWP